MTGKRPITGIEGDGIVAKQPRLIANVTSSTQYEVIRLRLDAERMQQKIANLQKAILSLQTEKDSKIAELQQDRAFLCKVEEELKERVEQTSEEKNKIKSEYSTKIIKLQNEKAEYEEKIIVLESEKRSLEQQVEVANDKVVTLKRKLESSERNWREELSELQNIIKEKDELIIENAKLVEYQKSSSINNNNIQEVINRSELLEQNHELSMQNRKLKYENDLFKECSNRVMVLEEKLQESYARLKRMQQVEEENASLKERISVMEKSTNGTLNLNMDSSVSSVKSILENALTIGQLQEQFGESKGKINILEKELADTRERLKHCLLEQSELANSFKDQQAECLRLEGIESVLREEIKMLKDQLEAVDKINQPQ